jgi:hypothetical protein
MDEVFGSEVKGREKGRDKVGEGGSHCNLFKTNQAGELPIILKTKKPKVSTTIQQRPTNTPENKLNKKKKQLWSAGFRQQHEPHKP